MKLKHLTGLSLLAPSVAFAAERPNIVLFIVDDMGWMDSAVAYGEQVYPNNLRHHTPNMVRLAEQGVMMTSAYVCPVSTPTRTSILSGMNAAHTRVTNWTSYVKDEYSDATGGGVSGGIGDTSADPLIRPDWNLNGMSPEPGIEGTFHATPFPQLLRDAGYFTIHVGKGHWAASGTPGASPYNMGFVVNVAGQVNGAPRSYYAEDHYGNLPGRWNYMAVQNLAAYYGTGTHLTEALTLEAIKTLDYPISHRQPFFLYMGHHGTHTPIQADERFAQKYRDAGMDEGQARYASMVEGVDKSLGDLMDYLEARGVAKNTVIIFLTDNGGNSENKNKGGIRHTHNKPLREGKGSCYEGGIRVPMLCSWSGKIAPNTRVNTPVIAEDLFPTILDIAGVDYEGKIVQDIDGQSLVNLLTKGSKLAAKAVKKGEVVGQKEQNLFVIPEEVSGINPLRPIVLHYPHKWKPYDLHDIDFLSCVRIGEWKLVYRMKTGALELYNLDDDIGEQTNVAVNNPDLTLQMAAVLAEKLRTWKADMPRINGTNKTAPLPDEL
ncbi:MAG: sulfatase [Alistipes sp.]|nr:sulfatase [Alistipes sp.]